jgi:outer membrane autotransporter protein
VSAVAGLIDRHIGDRFLIDEEVNNDEPDAELDDEMGMMGFFAFNELSATDVSSGTVNSNREKLEGLTNLGMNDELRTALAGELIGNAARIVMSSPHRTVFRHLESNPPVSRSTGWLGQARSHSKMQLWFTPYAQSEKGKADEYTFDGYTLTRAGLMLGGDVRLTQQIVGGAVFQYGNPNIKSDLGKITADDYMVGAYMKLPIFGQITVNGMVAYGMQHYSYRGPSDNVAFDGNAIFGSLEFTRPSLIGSKLLLTPIVGVDFQSLGMDDLAVTLPSLDRMAISPDGLDTVAVRVGLQGECYSVRARAQYIWQVSGNDYMVSTVGLGGDTASIRSIQWGKDWLSVGLGCDLGQLNAVRLSADYDCDISKNTTSHIGSIKAVVSW